MNRIVAWTTGAALVCLASTAAAERPFTEKKVQVSGHAGFGIYMGDGDLNPYGFGIGVRGGYTLDPNIYVGALFEYYLGETEEENITLPPFGTVASAEASANAWLFQGEIGYDFGVSRTVVLRPKLGLGATQLEGEVCATQPIEYCNDSSDGEFSAGFGLEVPISFDGLFVAPELRFNFVDDASGMILAAGIGGAF